MNVTQFAVLRCIARRSGEPLVRIAGELEMDRTSLYRAISPMMRDGWLADGESGDARYRTAKLTKERPAGCGSSDETLETGAAT